MGFLTKKLLSLNNRRICLPLITAVRSCYNYALPILEFYHRTTGQTLPETRLPLLKKKHPNIDKLSNEGIQCAIQILAKFGITALDACQNLHLFSMNQISMDNYGEILKECGFVYILPKHIIRYQSIVRNKSIASLKKDGVLRDDFDLEQALLDKFSEWPTICKTVTGFSDSSTPIVTIRIDVLQRYLKWRLSVTPDDFAKYLRNYLPLRHRPMSDVRESLDIAQNDIKFDNEFIRRNGFIISSDPTNTKLILENVPTLAGLEIRETLKIEPGILKNNYNNILQIIDILQEYKIPDEFQQKCLRIFCMRPDTVRERFEEIRNMKEYAILSTNPRVLSLIVHKKKVMNRLSKIQAAKKQCFSLNHLISANKIFNNYISNFGSKVCGRDIAILVNSSLQVTNGSKTDKTVLYKLKRHKYWLHVSLATIDENIRFLKQHFDDRVIFNNCQILMYPHNEIRHYIDCFLKERTGQSRDTSGQLDYQYNNVNKHLFTDDQILSLVLYEIEKKYHFSGDGIWSSVEGAKAEQNC